MSLPTLVLPEILKKARFYARAASFPVLFSLSIFASTDVTGPPVPGVEHYPPSSGVYVSSAGGSVSDTDTPPQKVFRT